jgi:hypothetical protein
MIFLQLESTAQFAVEKLLNSLPEGLLVTLFAWTTLRILPRQNSRTRFAVWFFALLAIASLPWLGSLTSTQPAAIHPSSGATGVLSRLLAPSGTPAAISFSGV